ncbi:MAG: hypothetical protein K6T16_01225 [Candidatus Pacearchaeota archaeon]|nr:hypothetical protein [Candidatus Pacearchaeota archaeon]
MIKMIRYAILAIAMPIKIHTHEGIDVRNDWIVKGDWVSTISATLNASVFSAAILGVEAFEKNQVRIVITAEIKTAGRIGFI